MLQVMDHMEATFILYAKIGTFTHLERSKNTLLTINKMGIVRLTIHHDFIASVSFMGYPRDSLRQTSADILSLVQ